MNLPSVAFGPPGGADLTPYPITPWAGASAGAWPSANQGHYTKFRVNKRRTVAGLRITVGAASGNAKAGLYSSDGTTLTQMALSASTPVAGSNAPQDILFTAAQQVVPFVDYFAFLACDNGTVTLFRLTTVSAAAVGPLGLDMVYSLSTQFVTPTTPITIAGQAGPASGSVFTIALI